MVIFFDDANIYCGTAVLKNVIPTGGFQVRNPVFHDENPFLSWKVVPQRGAKHTRDSQRSLLPCRCLQGLPTFKRLATLNILLQQHLSLVGVLTLSE